jgi:hypothetical protein
MMGGPYMRINSVLINLAEVAAVKRSRHDPTWATVVLLSGQTVDVHRPAAELIDDIGTLLRQDGSR